MSKESHPTTSHDDSVSASTKPIRKQNKIFNLFGPSSSESKVKKAQSTKTTFHHLSTVSTEHGADIGHAVSTTEVKSPASKAHPSVLPTVSRLNIFPENMSPPVGFVSLPKIGSRIEITPQLALCISFLPEGSDPIAKEENSSQVLWSGTPDELAWLDAIKQDPVEQERIRGLGARMVDEFIKDASKDSTKIAEIVLIGPVLENKHFRKLLSCTISAFDQAVLLDVDLLQGLVQLVQSAPSEALLPDDLVKILHILRVRLQDTHQQSSVHPFHLTLAVSRLLDVMAEHKVKDLDRVEEHEPLSGVLSGLKASSDPYLMYQACYAFQALQYIPNNESPLQAVLRHSTGAVDGLVMVSAVFKLDLGAVLEGLDKLQESLGVVVEVAGTVYNGACSLMESGRSVLESMKEGLGSGQKRPWYTAVRAAYAFVQAGQLKDFNTLICEAPCRRDPLFQWGISQLLGEIATDNIWGINVRVQAVDFLGELYKNDSLWNQDESVKTWMLNIIRQLCASTHQAVSDDAIALLKEINQDQATTTHLPYPLRNCLPLPASSPMLARVLAIPDVDFDLHRLRLQRLEDHRRGVYIHPQARPSLQASGDKLFPLMEKVLEFLASERQVFLVLGDSGSGKSTFNLELEQALWKTYKKHGPIPLHISLPTIDNPAQDLIENQLQYLNFSEDQIREMKLHRQFILICDGYDESQLKINIHTTNQFNRSGQWNVKMVISCRTQYLGQDYRPRFQPQPIDRYQSVSADLFQEAVVAAFSKTQIQQYVEEYVKGLPTVNHLQDQPSWTADEYMEKLTGIPNLMELVSNPFLLTLALDALPSVVESKKDLSVIKITRVQLYDSFVKRWLEVNRMRLEESPLSNDERAELDMLIEDNFLYHGVHYQRNLATSIFLKQEGNPVVKYTHIRDKNTWKAEFFCPTGQAKLLRESSTVMRSSSFFRFLHRSLLEYFYSRTIYDPLDYDVDDDGLGERGSGPDLMASLSRMIIVKELSILQFLAERVNQDPSFQQQLHDAIEQSKTDSSATTAATNAITILTIAGVTFHGANLCGIKIPGANLSYGQFDSAQLQGADLTGELGCGKWI
ncbi:hypothetical protein BGX24_001665 [Mortierella sp. AD032]|nr:hypothetical protein BGX24_001665 [Mortierella sp. AD032]